ncbi:RAD9B protein, partial [Podilymbus podiceps]|nr:RAD9B protein [Podilymbus podiceps]
GVLHCFLFLPVFGRAIHAIARISDEFWFDPVEKGLALRSVNSSRSAYGYIFFSAMFFQHYCWTAVSQPRRKEKQLSLPCRLIIKSVLPVFRYVNVLERNVEKCSIYTNINDHHITFQLLCKHGVVKTYNLTFQECDPLQAVFAKHVLLADVMIHFPTSQEEVTLSVTPMKVCFKSYTEEEADLPKTMLTEIQLNPDEFDYFQVGVDSEVTFCLKELRGLLAFSEATGVPVSIHFAVSGKPIAFSIDDMVLEASFVLATLSEVEKETASQQPPRSPQRQESAAAASGKAPHRESAKPASPGAKQEVTNVPRVAEREGRGAGGAAPAEEEEEVARAVPGGEAAESRYQKVRRHPPCSRWRALAGTERMLRFHSLFFGAVSCKEKDAVSHTRSLATASDTEEDFGTAPSSQV